MLIVSIAPFRCCFIHQDFLESLLCERKTLIFMHINILSKSLPGFSDPTSFLPCLLLHSSASVHVNVFRGWSSLWSFPEHFCNWTINFKYFLKKSALSHNWCCYLPLHPWLQYLGLEGFSVIGNLLTPPPHGGESYLPFPTLRIYLLSWKIFLYTWLKYPSEEVC